MTNVNASVSPASSQNMRFSIGSHTVMFLFVLYWTATVRGLVDAVQAPDIWVIGLWIVDGLNFAFWIIRDASRRGRPIPLLAQQWCFIFSSVFAAGYAIYSRGWRGAGWVILHGIGMTLVVFTAFYVCWIIIEMRRS